MLPNYLKILIRKQPLFTLINFIGLVIGMAAALSLFKYVRYETTYDLQTPHAKNIWQVFNQTLNGKTVTTEDTISKDYLKLILIAILIASPIAYYFMDKWLADFACKINIEWWIFAVAGTLAILIALATVSFSSHSSGFDESCEIA